MVPELSQTEEQQASTPVQESAPSETSKDSKTALEHRIAQRKKQIQYGKNTSGYDRYIMLVPINKRGHNDIWTPDVNDPVSKRRFDGKVRKWRRDLHKYDPKTPEEKKEVQEFIQSKGINKNENMNVMSVDKEKVQEAQTFQEDDIWDLL